MFNSNNYPISKAYQAQIIRQVENERIASMVKPTTRKTNHFAPISAKTVATIIAAVAIIIAMMVMPATTHAQDLADADHSEPFADAMIAYRVGFYYYNQGRYAEAVSKFDEAIGAIPPEIFTVSIDYAMMYWTMGDAQVMTGQYEQAIVSYETFIAVAGDQVNPNAIAYVASIREAISNGTAETVSLLVG